MVRVRAIVTSHTGLLITFLYSAKKLQALKLYVDLKIGVCKSPHELPVKFTRRNMRQKRKIAYFTTQGNKIGFSTQLAAPPWVTSCLNKANFTNQFV